MAAKPNGAAMPRLNPDRALFLFSSLAAAWRERASGGYFGGLVAPQQRYLPPAVRQDPRLLANYLAFAAIFMRGSGDSDRALAFIQKFHLRYPHFFEPRILARTAPDVLASVFRETARLSYVPTTSWLRGSGPASYKEEEFTASLVENARIAVSRFEGDWRNLFLGTNSFAEIFKRARLVGVREKITALLAVWFFEFGLAAEFPIPGVIDFHFLRLLLAHQIWQPELRPLREILTEHGLRRFRPHLWDYPAVRASASTVRRLMAWSEEFLVSAGLTSYEVSHGTWYLSREFCSLYPGNGATSSGREQRSSEIVLTSFASAADLRRGIGWRRGPDYCASCPVRSTCALAVPNAPYYRTGVLVVAGPRVESPSPELPVIDAVERDFRPRSIPPVS